MSNYLSGKTRGDYIFDIVPFPTRVEWNITDYCNLSCAYCLNSSNPHSAKGLVTEQCLRIADILSDGGVAYVTLIGGEPFARNDIFTIMDRLKHNRIIMEVVTNGILLDERTVEMLARLNPNVRTVQLSLHLPERVDHYKRVIKRLVENGIDVVTFIVVTRKNIHSMPTLFESILKAEPTYFALGGVCGAGRASGVYYEQNSVSFGEITELVMALERIKSKTTAKTHIGYKDRRMLAEYLIKGYNLHIMAHVCRAGIREFFIDGNGRATPCHFMEGDEAERYKTATLTQYASLSDVWWSPEFEFFRRDYMGRENARFVDSCSGCRHFKTGDC
ncbi:MAG: radical SAM protein, partial [Deltaproteobacteria bacterium]|nr:radical SAM protein [Deltaproteobacteria bacterium]